ncbi:MAG: hypothetical protein HYY93_15830 [Planctomycetes bacterium]|nr:hypothetical protein [Planctomycetota bacterium]
MRSELCVPFCARCGNPCPSDAVPAPEFDPPQFCKPCAVDRRRLVLSHASVPMWGYAIGWGFCFDWVIFGFGFRNVGLCGFSPLTVTDLLLVSVVAAALAALRLIAYGRTAGRTPLRQFLTLLWVHLSTIYLLCAGALLYDAVNRRQLQSSDLLAGLASFSALAAVTAMVLWRASLSRLPARPGASSSRSWKRVPWPATIVILGLCLPALHALAMVGWRAGLKSQGTWDGDIWRGSDLALWAAVAVVGCLVASVAPLVKRFTVRPAAGSR